MKKTRWICFVLAISLAGKVVGEQEVGVEPHTGEGEAIESMDVLYKVISPKTWEESLCRLEVVPSEIDSQFIHLSTKRQLAHVIDKYWRGQEYLVLKLATNKLVGRLAYEVNPGGTTRYYHLYEGSIPLEAVIEVSDP